MFWRALGGHAGQFTRHTFEPRVTSHRHRAAFVCERGRKFGCLLSDVSDALAAIDMALPFVDETGDRDLSRLGGVVVVAGRGFDE